LIEESDVIGGRLPSIFRLLALGLLLSSASRIPAASTTTSGITAPTSTTGITASAVMMSPPVPWS